jgi:nucleotide-binding universal stress UspA family protein
MLLMMTKSSPLSFFLKSKKQNKKALEKNITDKLIEVAKDASQKSSVKINTIISYGKIYEEINAAAKKLKCSFIIMGTNGTQGGIKRFIGSNALRVIREAPCPVITIKGKKHRFGCQLILLPLDLTQETRQKVNKAIELANYFGSAIKVASVVTTDDEFIVNKLKRQLSQVKSYIDEREIICTAELIRGDDVADELLKFAKQVKADLIMIMTQEEMNWTKRFIGSTTQEVINGTDIPVLTIRPKEQPATIMTPFSY